MSAAYSALASAADHILGNDCCAGFHIYGQPCHVCLTQRSLAKRGMDDALCDRFWKRLKLSHDTGAQSHDLSRQHVSPTIAPLFQPLPSAPSVATPQFDSYTEVNDFLRSLHNEQLGRRPALSPTAMEPDVLAGGSGTATGRLDAAQALPVAQTHFTLADVVQCGHAPGGRCLQCSGRLVFNVPLSAYSAFSRAYSTLSAASSSSSMSTPLSQVDSSQTATELAFPAFVSLAAGLDPQPGERLLHLGSGSGRAVVAWALLCSNSAACGVESSLSSHRMAESACSQLEPNVQQRIFLRHGDIFSVQSEWCQASIIVISAGSFDERSSASLVQGLNSAASGTRVVCLSQPLSSNRSRAPSGFTLAKEVLYRTIGHGNATAYIYRKN